MGVEIINERVIKLDSPKGFVKENTSVTTEGIQIESDAFVLANGSYAQSLIDQNPGLKSETPRLLFGGGGALNAYVPDWVKKWGGLENSLNSIP